MRFNAESSDANPFVYEFSTSNQALRAGQWSMTTPFGHTPQHLNSEASLYPSSETVRRERL